MGKVELIISKDEKPKEARLLSLANVEIFINSVTHGLIAITAFYCTWYCIKSGFTSHVSMHTFLSMIGYQILMAEGILVMYKHNSYTVLVSSKEKKTTIHWVLLAAGSLFAIAGTLVEFVWRQQRHHHSWHHPHALWGIASIFLLIPTVLAGITSLFPHQLRRVLKPLLSKFAHDLCAVACFVTGMVSVIYGFAVEKWSRSHDPGDMRFTIAWCCGIFTAVCLIGPARTFYQHIRSFLNR